LLLLQGSGSSPAELRALRTAAAGLKGYNIFCLDVPVSWPLSLVLSPSAMLKYQLLFRHLFFCRYVERSVCGAWVAHQACKELELRATLALSFTLRQKMLHFLQVQGIG
jgi:gamma-tubulin complex component 2